MSNVLVNKDKLDVLANAISLKSGEALTLTLDEMVSAVDGIEVGGGGITPTGNIDITQAGVTDVTDYATATVPSASPFMGSSGETYVTESGLRRWKANVFTEVNVSDGDTEGWLPDGYHQDFAFEKPAVPSNTSVTPTESAQTIGGANMMMEGAVTVNAIPSNYVGSGITQRDSTDLSASGATVTAPSGYYASNASYSIPYANFGVPSNERTKENGKFIYTRSFPQFTSGYLASASPVVLEETLEDKTVTPSTSQQVITPTGSNYYLNSVTVDAMPSGTEGTPSITVGSLARGERTITAEVTNTAGYISGSTKYASPVVLDASDFVSGSQTITTNDTYDVTYLSEVVVSVSGGGGSDVQLGFSDIELSSASSSIAFSGLSGEPTSFVIWAGNELTTGASPYKVAMVVYDGTNVIGQTITNTNNAQVTYDSSSFSYAYNNGTLTVTSTGAYFQPIIYFLDYTYGGTSGNIQTADVQVGSGATSITFTNLDDEPIYWSCIFKSNFSTSSGYQRVIGVVHDDEGTYGLEMDSSAKSSTAHWTATYNNGSLTITSQGTNAGGYFHQPGYYQLTYAISGDQSLQTKTVTPTEQIQNVTADTAQGYTALKKVVVNPIPSSYVQPTATKGATTYTPSTTNQTIASGTYLTGTQTISGDANLVAGNIKSGTTIFGVTGSYTGGGGGSVSFDTKTATASNYPVSLEFTSMKGEPKAFVCRLNAQVSSSGNTTYYYIVDIAAFGTTTHGNCFRIGGTRRVDNITSGYSWSYSGTTLTITSSAASRSASPGAFYSGSYELLYAY